MGGGGGGKEGTLNPLPFRSCFGRVLQVSCVCVVLFPGCDWGVSGMFGVRLLV